MRVFEVTLNLSFDQHELTEYDEEDDDFPEKQASFDATDFADEQLTRYLKSFDPHEFVEGLTFYEIVPNSAKWLKGENGSLAKITFRIEDNDIKYDFEEKYVKWDASDEEEKKPVSTDDIIKFIIDIYRYDSLEDGPYEGFDNGWVVPTADKKFEYGLMDYRHNEIIIVEVPE